MEKCLIIHNPKSGKAISKKILEEYKRILRERGYLVETIETKYQMHATEIMKKAGNYKLVFAIGGDGTLSEVVEGNLLRDEKLVICPISNGTCNDVAHMLGLGNDPIKNLNMLLDGETNYVDVGDINGKPFFYTAGIGKIVNVASETKAEDKKKYGYFAYLINAINEILNDENFDKIEVIIDGVKMKGKYVLALISNSNHIAGIKGIHNEVCLNDGKMEVLLCEGENKIDFLKTIIKFFLRIKTDSIVYLKAKEIIVRFPNNKTWCLDGESHKPNTNECRIKVLSRKIPMRIPIKRKKELLLTES